MAGRTRNVINNNNAACTEKIEANKSNTTPINTRSSKLNQDAASGSQLNKNSPLEKSLLALENRINTQLSAINKKLDLLDDSFGKNLQQMVENFENRFLLMNTKILNLEQQVQELQQNNSTLTDTLNTIHHQKDKLQRQVHDIERMQRLKDVIVRGIPIKDNDNPTNLIHAIAVKIGHKISPFTHAFRTKAVSKNSGKKSVHCPIIAKFPSQREAREFLSAFYGYGKGTFKLNVLENFFSDSFVYANESLTPANNKLLYDALQLRRSGVLFSATTRDGCVRVKVTKQSNPITVLNLDQLNSIAEHRERPDDLDSQILQDDN